ncbi:MAG TPA: CFI-box-CTERM domain-containing protein [Candidatus Angelobacter sp.]|jgi:tetratricopeptide (TPR) repeat protein|nr:CFI-box-CTERM domain-containing protein [Candidatus Angelobacter sp.]
MADPELTLLQRYADEIQSLGERLTDADPQKSKPLQKDLERKIEIYAKQLQVYKEKFPGTIESKIYESSLYGFQAQAKFSSVGFMRRASVKHNSLTLAIVAKQQEKSNANQALKLLDRAISIYDDGRSRFAKAAIYYSIKQKENALAELNHVIQYVDPSDEIYLQARQLKDEIENPPKKGMCFIATAAYGTALAPEVVLLSRFRDEVMLKSSVGAWLVKCYYHVSPRLAAIIRRSRGLRILTQRLLIRPMLRLAARWLQKRNL